MVYWDASHLLVLENAPHTSGRNKSPLTRVYFSHFLLSHQREASPLGVSVGLASLTSGKFQVHASLLGPRSGQPGEGTAGGEAEGGQKRACQRGCRVADQVSGNKGGLTTS